MSNSSSTSPSPIWLYSYIKLRFFSRIRRFIRSKARRSPPSDHDHNNKQPAATEEVACGAAVISSGSGGDDDVAAGLQRAVKRLHFGGWDEKESAAAEIGALAGDDVRIRKLMAGLGVVPALVAMAGSGDPPRRRAAVAALIQLANGTYTNKALIVEAGILSKIPKDTKLLDEATKLLFSELLLALSSLANTPFPLSLSENIVPFLMAVLESNTSSHEAKQSCLGTLYNLSTVLDNAGVLVSNDAVDTLLRLVVCRSENDSEERWAVSEKALATLGNLAVTLAGKKAMEKSPLVPESLIEALTWQERPKSQEWSAYILMVLAHQSSAQRAKMAGLGIVAVLLEVALLGSPLAQKRALKLLQWFRDERQARVGPHSGPQAGAVAVGSPVRSCSREGKRMMESLVRQSLHKNMEVITRRANIINNAHEAANNRLKALVISTSSKSLPY